MRHRDAMASMINLASLDFAESLGRFKPWNRCGEITEANLVFHLASVFTNHTPSGVAFVQVPFGGKGDRADERLDLLLSNSECGYVVKSKILRTEGQARSIAKDTSRLNRDLASELRGRHLRDAPTHWHGVVLAQTWNGEIVKRWRPDATAKGHRNRSGYPEDWHFDSVEVYRAHDGAKGTLFWVWGVGPEMELSPKKPN